MKKLSFLILVFIVVADVDLVIAAEKEFTFSMIKPHIASDNEKVKDIQRMIESNKLSILKAKKVKMTNDKFDSLYGMHKGKPFYNILKNAMVNKSVFVQVLEGKNAVRKYRDLMGATDPSMAKNGTIRAKYGVDTTNNAVHGADSTSSAMREICIFFQNEYGVLCSNVLK